jgi:hypothetical protein
VAADLGRSFHSVLGERIGAPFAPHCTIVPGQLIGARNQSHPLPTYLPQLVFL